MFLLSYYFILLLYVSEIMCENSFPVSICGMVNTLFCSWFSCILNLFVKRLDKSGRYCVENHPIPSHSHLNRIQYSHNSFCIWACDTHNLPKNSMITVHGRRIRIRNDKQMGNCSGFVFNVQIHMHHGQNHLFTIHCQKITKIMDYFM